VPQERARKPIWVKGGRQRTRFTKDRGVGGNQKGLGGRKERLEGFSKEGIVEKVNGDFLRRKTWEKRAKTRNVNRGKTQFSGGPSKQKVTLGGGGGNRGGKKKKGQGPQKTWTGTRLGMLISSSGNKEPSARGGKESVWVKKITRPTERPPEGRGYVGPTNCQQKKEKTKK